jgi:hypothetical protein|tara:strand:- start:282 stop:491 length:210 start_codon:yes stop_codon:yes gene_type:complete
VLLLFELSDDELLLLLPDSPLLEALLLLLEELVPSATFFFDPVLKSVSYQPLPFNRKAAAETNFFNFGA